MVVGGRWYIQFYIVLQLTVAGVVGILGRHALIHVVVDDVHESEYVITQFLLRMVVHVSVGNHYFYCFFKGCDELFRVEGCQLL